jgi:hypothetical protein
MSFKPQPSFDPKTFLAAVGEGRSIGVYRKDQTVFSQRDVCRQSFWDRRWLKIRESLTRLVCNIMRLPDDAESGDWRLSVVCRRASD